MGLIYVLIIGAVCGWLAGKLMKGGGFGIIVNIVLGIVGGFVGNYVLAKLLNISIGGGAVGDIITGLVGAVIVLFIAGLLKK